MSRIYHRRIISVSAALLVVFTAGPSIAFHPGHNTNENLPPDTSTNVPSDIVPQGPFAIACVNQGWYGIEIAIDHDGRVHCADSDDGGGESGGLE